MSKTTVRFTSMKGIAEKATLAAVKSVTATAFARMQMALGSKVWEWPNETIRSNGKAVTTPRTIVDSGLLRASGYIQINGKRSIIGYAARHATATHEGAKLKPKGIIRPRPWTDAVLGRVTGYPIEVYDYVGDLKSVWLKAILKS